MWTRIPGDWRVKPSEWADQTDESDCRECSQETAAKHGLRRRPDRRYPLPTRRKITATRTATAPTPWRRSNTGCRAGAIWGSNLLQWTKAKQDRRGLMDERSFYTEKEEIRKVKLVCPSCRGEFEAPVRMEGLPQAEGTAARRRRRRPPQVAKATSYMVRLEDLVALLQVPQALRTYRPVHCAHQRQSRRSE